MNFTDYSAGFLLGLSLIIAIGSQNAFVLKQGLKREHIFFVCLFCAVSDAILISAGVTGFGAVTARYPQVVEIAKIAGVIFLLGYGLQSLYASVYLSHALTVDGQVVTSLKKALLLCFGFTWLNPHVYLDTLVQSVLRYFSSLHWATEHDYLNPYLPNQKLGIYWTLW